MHLTESKVKVLAFGSEGLTFDTCWMQYDFSARLSIPLRLKVKSTM
jgi:hypothetical protein